MDASSVFLTREKFTGKNARVTGQRALADEVCKGVMVSGIVLGELACAAGIAVVAVFGIELPVNISNVLLCLWVAGVSGGAIGLFLEADRAQRWHARRRWKVR